MEQRSMLCVLCNRKPLVNGENQTRFNSNIKYNPFKLAHKSDEGIDAD